MEKTKHAVELGRTLRRRGGSVDYRESNEHLDELLGVIPSRRTRKTPDIARLRKNVEHACLASSLPATPAAKLATRITADGFRSPILIRGSTGDDPEDVRRTLGLRLPLNALTPEGLVAAVGGDRKVPTFDVITQDSGPNMTVQELALYHATPSNERTRLINVVSFSLSDTPLADLIIPPKIVRDLDLVSAVWPPDEDPRPDTLLYALLGPQGAYTDWHVDMGGSAVWYHVLQGCKVFLAAPSTLENLKEFESWSTSSRQTTECLGDSLSGCVRVVLHAGDTLLLPASWPHAVSTPRDSIVVGGNFLHALDYRAIADTFRREQRLGVAPKFQFPLFKQLMWYAACNALDKLQHAQLNGVRLGLSSWELNGLGHLIGLLEEWRRGDKGNQWRGGIPSDITDAEEFLQALKAALATAVSETHEKINTPNYYPSKTVDDQNLAIEGLDEDDDIFSILHDPGNHDSAVDALFGSGMHTNSQSPVFEFGGTAGCHEFNFEGMDTSLMGERSSAVKCGNSSFF